MLYSLNPLVGIIEGFRWSLLRGMEGFPSVPIVLSSVITLAIALVAMRQFLATDAKLADLA